MAGTDNLVAVSAALVAADAGQNTSSSADWFIYRGYMADQQDRAICLYETPGRPPLEAWAIDYPGFQVKVRGQREVDYQAVRDQIQAVFQALHANETLLGNAWVYFYATASAPLSLGLDEKKRISMVWNFRAMRNRVAA